MSFDGQAQLLGAIRIVEDVDSIGIALFGTPGGNTAFIAETDADLRITAFLDFHNYERYSVDYEIPETHKLKIYSLGQPGPLPFWLDTRCNFFEGDAESNDVFVRFGRRAIDDPILKDLRTLLADARNGVFREQQERWTTDDITSAFSDIFKEPPIHSRYWITRYGDAVRYARSITEPPHPIDEELRRSALDWIERFATKTDYDRVMSIMGHLLAGSITTDRARSLVFGFLINKVHAGRFSEIEKKLYQTRRFERLFPDGIYQYWWVHNWPKLQFEYKRPRNMLDPLITEIGIGTRRENFIRAERMAYLMFGRGDATPEIENLVLPLLNNYLDKLATARINADRILSQNSRREKWEEKARRVLYYYHILMALDGIIGGTHRLSRVTVDRRFGLDARYVRELEIIAGLQQP